LWDNRAEGIPRHVPYELFIGLRYTRAKRRNHFISFISLISMLGIALGVAALIVVLSVMNGFQKELRARILGVASHVQITGPDNQLADWQRVEQGALTARGVVAAAPYVNAQGLLANEGNVRGAIVRGIVPGLEDQVADIGRHMVAGSLDRLVAGEFGIVLGSDLARALRVLPGDKVTLIAPQGLVTPAGLVPRLKQFRVVGIFEVGMFEYDSGLALVSLEDAQKLFQLGDKVSGVRLKLEDLFQSRQVARDLYQKLGGDLAISDWTRSHANFFRAVEIEKRVMFIILTLIVAVAAFNIVSTLVMVVKEKQGDIAILRTLGSSPAEILRVFIVQGSAIGVVGTAVGLAAGITLALNLTAIVHGLEALLGVTLVDARVYFIGDLPADVRLADVLTVSVTALALGVLSTVYPAWRAARTAPADALRHEI